MGLFRHQLSTRENQTMVDITKQIQDDIQMCDVSDGMVIVYCPHTTAGISINENADPDVVKDLVYGYEKAFPTEDPNYRHSEGNSHAHMKSGLVGASAALILSEGKVILGRWQNVYFCEFDGPRTRSYYVKVIKG